MTGNLHKTYTSIYYELRELMDMKKKALSDTLIKRIAGTLPSGRVLLKGKKKPPGMAGKRKGNDEGLQGDRGGRKSPSKTRY